MPARLTSAVGSARSQRRRGRQLLQVKPRGFQQFSIFDIPDFLIGPASDIRNELPETPMGIAPAQICDHCQQIRTLLATQGRTSFTLGIRVTSNRGRSWITSAGTSSPGRNFAARVARVTPSLIRKCPSLPRTSCNGGIPSSEFPCLAIWRASLPGSAPCGRDGGKCSSPGSTSMNSAIPSARRTGRLILLPPIRLFFCGSTLEDYHIDLLKHRDVRTLASNQERPCHEQPEQKVRRRARLEKQSKPQERRYEYR